MREKMDVGVSVEWFFDSRSRSTQPRSIIWQGRERQIKKIGLQHTYREGRTLFHVFSVVAESLFFRLELNSETLNWRLTEVADGLPN